MDHDPVGLAGIHQDGGRAGHQPVGIVIVPGLAVIDPVKHAAGQERVKGAAGQRDRGIRLDGRIEAPPDGSAQAGGAVLAAQRVLAAVLQGIVVCADSARRVEQVGDSELRDGLQDGVRREGEHRSRENVVVRDRVDLQREINEPIAGVGRSAVNAQHVGVPGRNPV